MVEPQQFLSWRPRAYTVGTAVWRQVDQAHATSDHARACLRGVGTGEGDFGRNTALRVRADPAGRRRPLRAREMWRADIADGDLDARKRAQHVRQRLSDGYHTIGPLAISAQPGTVSRRADNRRRWARLGYRIREGQELTRSCRRTRDLCHETVFSDGQSTKGR